MLMHMYVLLRSNVAIVDMNLQVFDKRLTHSVDSKKARTRVLRCKVGCRANRCRNRWRLSHHSEPMLRSRALNSL